MIPSVNMFTFVKEGLDLVNPGRARQLLTQTRLVAYSYAAQ